MRGLGKFNSKFPKYETKVVAFFHFKLTFVEFDLFVLKLTLKIWMLRIANDPSTSNYSRYSSKKLPLLFNIFQNKPL